MQPTAVEWSGLIRPTVDQPYPPDPLGRRQRQWQREFLEVKGSSVILTELGCFAKQPIPVDAALGHYSGTLRLGKSFHP